MPLDASPRTANRIEEAVIRAIDYLWLAMGWFALRLPGKWRLSRWLTEHSALGLMASLMASCEDDNERQVTADSLRRYLADGDDSALDDYERRVKRWGAKP